MPDSRSQNNTRFFFRRTGLQSRPGSDEFWVPVPICPSDPNDRQRVSGGGTLSAVGLPPSGLLTTTFVPNGKATITVDALTLDGDVCLAAVPRVRHHISYVDAINLFELLWWPLLGTVIAIRSRRASPPWSRLGFLASFWLILFGLSDGVELFTKAWWPPWWLLAWKGTCITALLFCAVARIRMKQSTKFLDSRSRQPQDQ